MKDIVSGDALLVDDHCYVRTFVNRKRVALKAIVRETPTSERRTYIVELETGELLERDWMLLDRVTPPDACRQSPASIGKPIEWDAHAHPNHRDGVARLDGRTRNGIRGIFRE